MTTKLILVRHAKSIFNEEGVYPLSGPCKGLSDLGLKQAKLIADRLKDMKIDVIFSSPRKRVLQTAEEINKYHNISIIESEKILDMDYGVMAGKTSSLNKMPPEQRDIFEKRNSDENFRIPDGESYNDMKKRIKEFIQQIMNKYKDKTILIVCHKSTIRVITSVIMNKPHEEVYRNMKGADNTSYSEIDVDNNGNPDIITYACDNHLKNL